MKPRAVLSSYRFPTGTRRFAFTRRVTENSAPNVAQIADENPCQREMHWTQARPTSATLMILAKTRAAPGLPRAHRSPRRAPCATHHDWRSHAGRVTGAASHDRDRTSGARSRVDQALLTS
jgi:hypothetical protein